MSEERPVYLRLRDRIGAMILDGTVSDGAPLPPVRRLGARPGAMTLDGPVADGDPLPSVRSLAAECGANPLTVAKAYQTFQEEGLVGVRRGAGTFRAGGAAGGRA